MILCHITVAFFDVVSHLVYLSRPPQLGEIVSISELKEKQRIGVRVLNTEVIDGIPLESVIIRDQKSENALKTTANKSGIGYSPNKSKNKFNFVVERSDNVKPKDGKRDKDKEKRKIISKSKSTSSIKLKFGEITIVSKSNSDERLLGPVGCHTHSQELGSTQTSNRNLSGMDGHRPKVHRPLSAQSTHARTAQSALSSEYSETSKVSKADMGGSKSNVDNRKSRRDGSRDFDGAYRSKTDHDNDDCHANSHIDTHSSVYSDGQCNDGSQVRDKDRESTHNSEQIWSRQGQGHPPSQRAKIASVPSSGTYDSLMNDSVISLNSLDSDRSSSYMEQVPMSSSRCLREGDRGTDRRMRRGEGNGYGEGDGEVGKDYSWMKPLRPATATSLSLSSTSREHKYPFSAIDSMPLGGGQREVRDIEHCDNMGSGRVSNSNSNSNTCEEYDSDDMQRAGYCNYSSTDTNSNSNGTSHRALYRGQRQELGQRQRHDIDDKADDSNYRNISSNANISRIYKNHNSDEVRDIYGSSRNRFDPSRQEMNSEKDFLYDSTGSDDKANTIGRTARDVSVPHYVSNQLFEFDHSKLQTEHSALYGMNAKSSFAGGNVKSNSAAKSKSGSRNGSSSGSGYANGSSTGMGDVNNNSNSSSSHSHSHSLNGTKTKAAFSSSSDAQRPSRPATAGSRQQQQSIKQNFADMFSNGKGFDISDEKEKSSSFSRSAQHSSSTDNVKNDMGMGSRKSTKVFNKFGVTNNFEVPDKLPNTVKNTEFSLSGFGYGNESHTNKGNFTDFLSTSNSMRKNASGEKENPVKASFSRPQSASTRRTNSNSNSNTSTMPFDFAMKQEAKGKPKGKMSLADYFTHNEFLTEAASEDKTSADKIDTKEFVYKYEDYTHTKESGRNDRSERSSNSERSCSSTLKSSNIKDYYDAAEVERIKREKMLIARESTRAEKELLRQKILLENELKSLQNTGKNKV
jgi:hypothetical protein